jgi:AraC-like DNA-binding protein
MLPFRQVSQNPDHAEAPVVGSPDHRVHGSLPSHRHACHQLIYTVRGAIQMTTPQGQWVLPPSRALWIVANTDHVLFAKHSADTRVLYIQPHAVGAPDWKDCTVLEVSPLVRELVIVCASQPWDYSPQSPQARLAQVLLDQLSALPHSPVSLPMPLDARARRMVQLLQDDPAGREPLAALAVRVGASPRTIERLFATETHMSFGAWRHRHRLLAALEQLAHGESVTNVAFAVGYESASSFIASFRAMFGVTPARYFAHPEHES